MIAVDTLMAARYQMALSLGFHIVLSCFGVAFPFLIYLLHRRGLKKNDADALTLARRWSKVAAVSGFGAIVLLYRKKYSLARIGATVAVGTVLLGWGVAQWPDFLIDHATLDDVAGARPTQIGLVIVFGLAAVTAVPALVWLLYLVNRRDQSLQN